MKRLFDLTFTECVRKQDRFHALLGVTGTPGGRRALWNLVRSRIAPPCQSSGGKLMGAEIEFVEYLMNVWLDGCMSGLGNDVQIE